MTKKKAPLPPIESLACPNAECALYGLSEQGNLIVRKVYGKNDIRYLRCRQCREEFSERKNTALFNSKSPEEDAIEVCHMLTEGMSVSGIARVKQIGRSTIHRLDRRSGKHGRDFHDHKTQNIAVEDIDVDERHGYAGSKDTKLWTAEAIDPKSRYVISQQIGQRDEQLVEKLYADTAKRLKDKHKIVVYSDGFASYSTLFPLRFGVTYQPPSSGKRGRPKKIQYRIPRTAAHVRVVKNRVGMRLESVVIDYSHGSRKRVQASLEALGHNVPNTSAIERRNLTARRMDATQQRRTITFARTVETRSYRSSWGLAVYNWCRSCRSLRVELPEPMDKKSFSSGHLLWPLV